MNADQPIESMIARIGEQLFEYAIDRSDMNAILDALPLDNPDKRVVLEYEIQLLRIVSVGWAITYFLAEHDIKRPLVQCYWEGIQSLSTTLSTSAALTTNTQVDYFDTLKQRLDHYVGALDAAGKIPDPAMAIGPAFAGLCSYEDDACAVLAGTKMFAHTIRCVREYLDAAVSQQREL